LVGECSEIAYPVTALYELDCHKLLADLILKEIDEAKTATADSLDLQMSSYVSPSVTARVKAKLDADLRCLLGGSGNLLLTGWKCNQVYCMVTGHGVPCIILSPSCTCHGSGALKGTPCRGAVRSLAERS